MVRACLWESGSLELNPALYSLRGTEHLHNQLLSGWLGAQTPEKRGYKEEVDGWGSGGRWGREAEDLLSLE